MTGNPVRVLRLKSYFGFNFQADVVPDKVATCGINHVVVVIKYSESLRDFNSYLLVARIEADYESDAVFMLLI